MKKYLFVCQNEQFKKLFSEQYEENKNELGYEAEFMPLLPDIRKCAKEDRSTEEIYQNTVLSELNVENGANVVCICDNDKESRASFFLTVSKLFCDTKEAEINVVFKDVNLESETFITDTLKSVS